MKRTHLHIIGAILAIFTGIMRAFGGFILMFSHVNGIELGVGIGLVLIGMLLIGTGIPFLINMGQKNPRPDVFIKILTVGMVAYWIDGIVNGFLLYGAPQVVGQIINTSLLIAILFCLWAKKKS